MKDLRAIRGAALIRRMVDEGEHVTQDFKYLISDARKIARSISAFANNRGGRLLIGVKDNGVIAGVRNEEDIYVVEQAAERYCRPAQAVDFKAYKIEGTVRVIVAEIAAAEKRPVSVVETTGELKAYYRVADENIAAHPLMVKAWQLAASGRLDPLSERHYALTSLLQQGPMTERQIALALHISQSTADALIARLAAAGLITFRHTPARFVIGVPD